MPRIVCASLEDCDRDSTGNNNTRFIKHLMNTMTIDTALARRQMVRQQVRTSDVFDDTILGVLDQLQRHDFVPPRYADLAYSDTEIPLGRGQFMMTPTVEGQLLQALAPGAADRALEIGTGSGFLAACLARLAASVVSVDIVDDFVASATRKLDHADIDNAELHVMDAMQTLPDESFDVIAVTGSLAEYDNRFETILNPGGRLFVIVGDAPVMQARLITRGSEGMTTTALFETCIAPLQNAGRDTTFSF